MTQESLFSQQSVTREPDICINRHRRSDTSMLADKRVNKNRDRELIYNYVKSSGAYGLTLDEMSIVLDRPCNCISGRFSELKRAGRIIASAETRRTRTGSVAHVYVVAQ
jgi:predicted transcriptional regulator